MTFDPNAPFDVVDAPKGFDPSQPFDVVAKPKIGAYIGTPLDGLGFGGSARENEAGYGATDRAAHSMSQGSSDEIEGALSGLVHWAGNHITGDGNLSLGDAIDQETARYRKGLDDYAQDHPTRSAAAGAIGALAPMGGVGAGSISARFAPVGPAAPLTGIGAENTVARWLAPTSVGKAAVLGAGMGGASGFLDGQGDLGARASSALSGALTGGALAGGLGALGYGASKAFPFLSKAAKSLTGLYDPAEVAGAKIGDRLAEAGITAPDVAQAIDAAGGKPLTLADIGGPSVQRYARTVADMPGSGSTDLTQFLTERDLGSGTNPLTRTGGSADRVAGDLDRTFGSSGYADTVDQVLRRQKAVADPLYKAFEQSPPVPADTFAPVLGRPAFQDALGKAVTIAKNEGEPSILDAVTMRPDGSYAVEKQLTPRAIDYIKKGLDDVLDGSRDQYGRMTQSARAVAKLKSQFLDLADQAIPSYAPARNAWAGDQQMLDALEAGKGAARADGDFVKREFDALSPGEQEMYRTGFRQALVNTLKNTRDGADEIKRLVGTPAMRERMQAVLQPQEYQALIDPLGTEAQMYATRQAVLGGSRTAPSMADLADEQAGAIGKTLGKAATSGPVSAAVQLALGKLSQIGGTTPRVADAAAKYLTETDPATVKQIAADLLAQRASKAAGTAMMRYGLNRTQLLALGATQDAQQP